MVCGVCVVCIAVCVVYVSPCVVAVVAADVCVDVCGNLGRRGDVVPGLADDVSPAAVIVVRALRCYELPSPWQILPCPVL